MQIDEFKQIVTAFADGGDDIHFDRNQLLVQIRDQVITASLSYTETGGLCVEEHGNRMRAESWIFNRLAMLPALAERICSYVKPPKAFVSSSGEFLDDINSDPSGASQPVPDAAKVMIDRLGKRLVNTTSVLYLSSDAGEGKTSLIEELAVRQANRFKAKESNWLLVPVPLGGRPFLRFDDVVISTLVNRLKFQYLYYDAFLALVRMGVVVPAFDGFEEMIVESASGEALSAFGGLVDSLRSAGTLLVAARKAYFEHPDFGSQARLFDSIGIGHEVTFSRLSLNRWDERTFNRYARERQVPDPDRLFHEVAGRLDHSDVHPHPVLTRAVLVKRLVDVATRESDLSALLDRIGTDQRHYFHDFVDGIVEREAHDKWTDKSGDSSGALLVPAEHHELLSMIAQEMWLCATDGLAFDVVDLIVDLFADAKEKSPAVVRQIKKRIQQHALLVVTSTGRTELAFDHEDYRVFYLGQALGRALASRDTITLKSITDAAALPASAVTEAASYVRRRDSKVILHGLKPSAREPRGDRASAAVQHALALLQSVANSVLPTSFVRENAGVLTLALLDDCDQTYRVTDMNFPAGALCGRRLRNVTICNSYFPATALNNTELSQCAFVKCHFERLEVDGSERISGTSFDDAWRVDAMVRVDREGGDQLTRFAPRHVRNELTQAGFDFPPAPADEPNTAAEQDSDEDLVTVQRFLRAFQRATALDEGTVRRRLGRKANRFFGKLLPQLRRVEVVQEVRPQGGHSQPRLRLGVRMIRIEQALRVSGGKFEGFLHEFENGTA